MTGAPGDAQAPVVGDSHEIPPSIRLMDFGGRPEVVMSAVIATPDRLVIVGESGSQEEDYQITIWTAAFQD